MSESLYIASPLDGDFLNGDDGVEKEGKLTFPVHVKGTKTDDAEYKVNDVQLEYVKGSYTAMVTIFGYHNIIQLTDKEGHVVQKITVFWAKDAYKKYRLSLDDNIWFLKDIAKNEQLYKSIFDNKYLGFFKRLHEAFGTKVHFNLYYEDGDFNLSQMPVKYKQEWQQNAHWIALTFHALGNDPDKPYLNTTYEKINEHCKLITNEIVRFAGQELLSPYTTVHWGEVTKEGCNALKDFGFKGLVGYFILPDGIPAVSYYLDPEKTAHLNGRDIWYDKETGLSFIKIDMVINTFKKEEVIPLLEGITNNPHESGFIELMIHEQYFYQDYPSYQPDYEQKVWDAVKFVSDKGYKPAFLKEVLK